MLLFRTLQESGLVTVKESPTPNLPTIPCPAFTRKFAPWLSRCPPAAILTPSGISSATTSSWFASKLFATGLTPENSRIPSTSAASRSCGSRKTCTTPCRVFWKAVSNEDRHRLLCFYGADRPGAPGCRSRVLGRNDARVAERHRRGRVCLARRPTAGPAAATLTAPSSTRRPRCAPICPRCAHGAMV